MQSDISTEADGGDEPPLPAWARRLGLVIAFVAALGGSAAGGYALGQRNRASAAVGAAAYDFELAGARLKLGEIVLTLRLLHKPTGRPVPDAVVFAARLDMAPDGMATMTAPLEPLPPSGSGTYRFKTELAMEGSWQLSVAAKVQGEVGTVQSRLLLQAMP